MKTRLLLLAIIGATGLAQDPSRAFQEAHALLESRILDDYLVDLDGDGWSDVVFVAGDDARDLVCLLFDPEKHEFKTARRLRIPKDVAALTTADLLPDPGFEIVLLSCRGVEVARVRAEGLSPYSEIDLIFAPESPGVPRPWSRGRDLDGDGRDDLLVPGIEDDWILLGGPDGRPKASPVRVTPPKSTVTARTESGLAEQRHERPRIEMQRVSEAKEFLPVFLDGEGCRMLRRLGGGDFGGAPETLFAFGGGGVSLGALSRVSAAFDDLDGDRVQDLVVSRNKVEGGRIPELRTELLLFANGGKSLAKPTQVLLLPGVLSKGPDLIDVDHDGRKDLVFSVFAGDLKGQVTRAISGSVKLSYFVYRGTGSSPPFPRSPDLTVDDGVPADLFDTWNLRHRIFLDQDWTGDGRIDLLRVAAADSGLLIELRPAPLAGHPDATSKPTATFQHDGPVTGYRTALVAPGIPALILSQAKGLSFLTLR